MIWHILLLLFRIRIRFGFVSSPAVLNPVACPRFRCIALRTSRAPPSVALGLRRGLRPDWLLAYLLTHSRSVFCCLPIRSVASVCLLSCQFACALTISRFNLPPFRHPIHAAASPFPFRLRLMRANRPRDSALATAAVHSYHIPICCNRCPSLHFVHSEALPAGAVRCRCVCRFATLSNASNALSLPHALPRRVFPRGCCCDEM